MSEPKSVKKYILIVEDHPSQVDALSEVIKNIRPEIEILNASTTVQAQEYINSYYDRLELVSIDLGLPEAIGSTRTPATNGIDLLRKLLTERPTLNLMVNTGCDPKKLSGLKSALLDHTGGFVFIHKSADKNLMAEKIRIALSGELDYRSIKSNLGDFPIKPIWLEALQLAAEGYDNAEIHRRMKQNKEYKATYDRTIDHYLKNVGEVIGIYPELPKKERTNEKPTINFRVALIKMAREKGLID